MNARTCRRNGLTRARGFTLIELIVAMVVIAILAAIAIPNYSDYLLRSRRSDAQAFLLAVAARQQHFLVDRRAYSPSITDAPTAGGLGMAIPDAVATFYDVSFTAIDNNATPPVFTVSAAPRAGQTGDRCGTLGINQAGTRTASTGATRCW
jgi:type IV pilus assembly protein PilE